MYIHTNEGLGQTVIVRNEDERVKWSLGEPQPAPRTCDNRAIPGRAAVQALTARRVACTQHNAFGVTDPFGVISRAVARALEMLDNTIGELVNARNAVCAGATPASPLLGNITLDWLRNRLGVCIDDIRVWTAGTFVNRSVAEVIRRLVRVRNLIGSNLIRYSCSSPRCEPDVWAFVMARDAAGNCLPGTPQMLVRLCRRFWVPAVRDGTPVPPEVHAEFQAQVIIHEASHLTHCTRDPTGSTIGVAECLRQFVAATNGSPLYRGFEMRCHVTNRRAGAAAAARPGVAELGFAGPGSIRIEKTIFRPQNAIRLKGRPAVPPLGRGLGDAPSRTPWRVRLGLRPKPQYLRFMNLDQFNWNEASLTARLRQMIGHLAKHVQLSWKSMQPIGFIRLIGHTDNTGPEKYNVDLGGRRARAVKEELENILKEDILKGRIRIAILVEPSPGPSAPTADNSTSKGRALNRRVEVFVAPLEPLPEPKEKPIITIMEPPPGSVIQTKPDDWRRIPPGPPGKSLERWLDDRLKPLPQGRRIRDAILKGSCSLLEELFRREGGTLSEKQKEDFRKQCRDAAKRPL